MRIQSRPPQLQGNLPWGPETCLPVRLLLAKAVCAELSGSGQSAVHTCGACVHAKSLSRVRLIATPWTVAHQAPLSRGILQARIQEWVAMPSSRGSSPPRDRTRGS